MNASSCRARRQVLIVLTAAVVALLPWAGVVSSWTGGQATDDMLLPNGKAAEVTGRLCGSCHGIGNFAALRMSQPEWKNMVDVMVNLGAQISEDESSAITEYLAEVFGPESPPLIDVNLASREDLEKLEALDEATVERLLAVREERGRFKTLKQVQDTIGSDAFENVKGYLTVR